MSETTEKEEVKTIRRSAPIDIIFPPGFKKQRPRRQYRFYSEDDYNPVRLVPNVPGTSVGSTSSTSYENKLDKVVIDTADEAHCAIQYFNPLRPVRSVPGTSTQDAQITYNGNTQSTNSSSTSTQDFYPLGPVEMFLVHLHKTIQ
ncbi:hypothetical protein WA026_022269 [Henosepilachna vigintioctopunctata]|uniref:Uncharacterized protein n=1 Tax=Henosepilachna vigintioctopunctata TaxID=420089 RepID=A0AAW1VC75_9CUCU